MTKTSSVLQINTLYSIFIPNLDFVTCSLKDNSTIFKSWPYVYIFYVFIWSLGIQSSRSPHLFCHWEAGVVFSKCLTTLLKRFLQRETPCLLNKTPQDLLKLKYRNWQRQSKFVFKKCFIYTFYIFLYQVLSLWACMWKHFLLPAGLAISAWMNLYKMYLLFRVLLKFSLLCRGLKCSDFTYTRFCCSCSGNKNWIIDDIPGSDHHVVEQWHWK